MSILSYALSIAIVLAGLFVFTFAADKLYTEIGLFQSTPARIAANLLGSGVGFVIGVSLVTIASI
ncbi:hypothetical protein GCM10025751_56450 [Haladaptatus pallidirubidus]|uniref:DUF350 domain-containing protein n=2 Tax=Haladaptatus pallidirubidus TaxID=1008152 RepID=A0AAV3URK7_9EURY